MLLLCRASLLYRCSQVEDIDSDEKRFDKWLKRFEERASLAGWTDEQRFHQFKFHLSQSALHVF